MRFLQLGLALSALICFVNAAEDELEFPTEPAISATATFPEDNPFGQVVNGERNRINLLVENNSEQNVTLVSVSGTFHDPESNTLIKNASSQSYGLPLMAGTKLQLPYQFHSEFRAGDVRLNIWLTHVADGQVYKVTAYDSIVTVVEPEISIFNYQVISTYLITLAFLGGMGYLAYNSFFPKTKKSRKPVTSKGGKQAISSPVGVTASTTVEEEWIPEHHLKKTRAGKRKEGVLSSGDEVSGAETSGPDGRKRKGRK